jgi:hypothetical protein
MLAPVALFRRCEGQLHGKTPLEGLAHTKCASDG